MRKFFLFVTFLVCFKPTVQLSAIEKLEILHEISVRHVANREKIVTWEGKVEVLDRYSRPNETQSATCEVEYALNRAEDQYRWTFRQLKLMRTVDGKQETDLQLYQVGGIRTKGGVTRLDAFDHGDYKGPQALGIHEVGYFHPGPGSLDFDPMYYFQEGSRTVEARFDLFYEMSGRPHPRRTTNRVGTCVTYREDFNVVNEFTVDLAQGANLVESLYTESDENGGLLMETKVNTKYQMISDIWVPSNVDYVSRRPQDGTSFTRSFTWVSQTVNGELDDAAFSLATIGAKDGDIVSDNRSGIGLTIAGGNLVPAGNVPFNSAVPESKRVRWLVILAVSVFGLACMLAFMYRDRRRKSH